MANDFFKIGIKCLSLYSCLLLTACDTINHSEKQATEKINNIPIAADTAMGIDTTVHLNRPTIFFEWSVQAKNNGLAFKDFALLSDNSIIASLSPNASSGTLAYGFYDSKGRKIMDHYTKTYLLLKLKANGEKDWWRSYDEDIPNSNYIQLIDFTVKDTSQVVSLVHLKEDYFREQEERKRHELEMSESEDEQSAKDESTPAEREKEEESRISNAYALEYIDANGSVDSIVILKTILPETNILAIERFDDKNLVIAGNTIYSSLEKAGSRIETSKDFVALIDDQGKVLWSDILPVSDINDGIAESLNLTVGKDGSIYLSGIFTSDLKLKNGQLLKASKKIPGKETNARSYIISYSSKGNVNWARGSNSHSYTRAIKSTPDGVLIAQSVYGNNNFDHTIDTTGHIYEFLSFLDRKGNTMWSRGFPVNHISSIAVTSKSEPVIVGNYNDPVYGGLPKPFSFDNIDLNKDHDLFIFILSKNGMIKESITENLNLRTDFNANVPKIGVGKDDAIILSCHSNNYFKEYVNLQTMEDLHNAGEISFLGKLRSNIK